jgi:hypothetical protein
LRGTASDTLDIVDAGGERLRHHVVDSEAAEQHFERGDGFLVARGPRRCRAASARIISVTEPSYRAPV